MENHLKISKPNIYVIVAFIVLFAGYILGVRFENIYASEILGLVLYFFPIYALVLIAKTKFEKKFIKVGLLTVFAIISVGSLLPISFNLLTLASIQNGQDPSFEKIHNLSLGSWEIVTYRTNGGATVDFGIIVRAEKSLLPGIYVKHDLVNIYHASDINLSIVEPDSIKMDSIRFTSPQRQAEYLSDNPKVTEGNVIKVN